MNKFSGRTFESILDETVCAFRTWKAKYGHDLERTRIGTYKRELENLVQLGPEGRLKIEESSASRKFEILRELYEFLFVSRAFLKSEKLASSDRVAKVFRGPDLTEEENETSNLPRNTLFELAVATSLAYGGVEPDISGKTDVKATDAGKTFHIECKRPLSTANVGKNISKAKSQLRETVKTESDFGIIAVCISRLIHEELVRIRTNDMSFVGSFITSKAEAFANEMFSHWYEPGVVSALQIRVCFSGILMKEDMPFNGQFYFMYVSPHLSDERSSSLEKLNQKLSLGIQRDYFRGQTA